MFYTYLHRRESDNAIFYVGKGQKRRAWECVKRSEHWQRVKNKHGHKIEICAEWPTEAEAFDHEKFLIACFRDMGEPLVNVTDGGEGVSGYVFTQEQVTALKTRVKKQWEDSREKMLASLTSDEFKARISVTSKEYANRPDVKSRVSAQAKERANRPDVKEVQTALFKEYANRPEVKARVSTWAKEYMNRSDVKAARSKFSKEYANRPEVKARVSTWAKEYMNRPDVKAARSGTNNSNARAIVCDNGMMFGSISLAVEWLKSLGFTKARHSSFCKPLSIVGATAYGFQWRYAETNESLKKEP